MLASVIITRATDILQDTTSVRWPTDELLRWASDAQREIVLYKPEASVTNTTLSLTTNQTKQSLPSTALTLISIVRNMGTNGATPGRAVRLIQREVLDAQLPNWHSETGAAETKHYMFDNRDPRTFYVYPKPSGTLYLECVYSVAPTDLTSTSQALSLNDIYANIILDYMLYRAYSKDAEYAENVQRALAHYTAFSNALGIKTRNDNEKSPNANSPMNPNHPTQARVQ
jgi:hypothetical protein